MQKTQHQSIFSSKFKSFPLNSLTLAVLSFSLFSQSALAFSYSGNESKDGASNNIVEVNAEGKVIKGISGQPVLTSEDYLYGGNSSDTESNSNQVVFHKKNNPFKIDITGGRSDKEYEANNNQVILENIKSFSNNDTNNIIGGESGITKNNLVKITGDEDSSINGEIAGGDAYKESLNNKVILKNITLITHDSVISGGEAEVISNGNQVLLENIKLLEDTHIFAGYVDEPSQENDELANVTPPYIPLGKKSEANHNKVIMKNITLGATAEIVGGMALDKDETKSQNNQIILENVKAQDYLQANKVIILAGMISSDKGDSSVENNSITLMGDTNLANISLYGGLLIPDYQDIEDIHKSIQKNSSKSRNNTLNIGYIDENNQAKSWHSANPEGNVINGGATEFGGFQKIKFNAVDWDQNKAALIFKGNPNLSGMTIDATNVVFVDKADLQQTLKQGQYMILLKTDSQGDHKLQSQNVMEESIYSVGSALKGKATVTLNANGDVIYTIGTKKNNGSDESGNNNQNNVVGDGKNNEADLSVAAQTHNVVIGHTAALTAVNGGQSLVEKALNSGLIQSQYGSHLYFATSGGYDKYKTGSHIKTNVWNANLSVVNTVELATGGVAYLAGLEYGTGSYDVKDDGINGDGDVDYQGLTLGAKYLHNSGLYTEGAVRVGHIKNKANNVLTNGKKFYSYQTSGYYAGGHFGLGYILALNENLKLDLYSQYSYMNIEKDKFYAGGEYSIAPM